MAEVNYLKALNSISAGIDMLAKSIDKNNKTNSELVGILQSGDFGKQFASLKKSIDDIKSDTQKILKNQHALGKPAAATKTPSFFEKIGENKSKIKEGAGMVVLIAAGVLAIGAAFKLIGHVDFVSVIALSIALPLVAFAFEKIATMKNLKPADMKNMFLVLGTMSLSLLVSSYFLSKILPVSPQQGLTAILIAGTFAVVSFGIEKIAKSIKDVKPADMKNMFLVLGTMSLSLLVSSYFLSKILPVSPQQGLTAILIAGTFAVVSFGIEKIAKSIKDVKAGDMLKMSLILIPFAFAITASSWIMQLILPISPWQGLTAILIAATFAVVSFGIEKIAKSIKDVDAGDMLKMSLILVPFAAAITMSSWIMQLITPIKWEQGLTAIAIASTMVVMSLALPFLSEAVSKTSVAKVALMVAIMPLFAGAIALSSYALINTKPIDNGLLFNIVLQSIALGISSVALGATVWALGKLGVNLTNVIEGGLCIIALAGVIWTSSHILAAGNYGVYPSLEWAEGVGLSLLAFGVSVAALGFLIETGIGAPALILGGIAVLGLSGVIVAAAAILNKGNFTGGPTKDWAEGVGVSLAAFGLGVMLLGGYIVGSLGLGLVALKVGALAVDTIANSIVSAASILNGGNFTGGPKKEWSEGVGVSLAAFGLGVMLLGGYIVGSLGLGLVALKVGALAVDTIANSIVSAASILNGGNFTGGPKKEWSEGVAMALGAFAPVFKILMDKGIINSLLGGPSVEDMNGAIMTICGGLVAAANYFNDPKNAANGWKGGPSAEWSAGVGGAIGAFAPVFDYLSKNSGWFGSDISKLTDAIGAVITSIAVAASTLNGVVFSNNIPDGYMDSLNRNIRIYVDLMSYIQDQKFSAFDALKNSLSVSGGLYVLAKGYDSLAKSIKNLGTAIATLDVAKMEGMKSLNSSVFLLSIVDPDNVEKVLDAMEKKTGVYLKIFEDAEKKSSNKIGSSGSVNTPSGFNKTTATMDDMVAAINNNTQVLVQAIKSSSSSLLEELRVKSNTNSIKNRGK